MSLALDKQTHLLAGAVLAAMALPFGLPAAALVPVVIGFAKELADPYLGGQRDAGDFACTVAGAAAYLGYMYAIGAR